MAPNLPSATTTSTEFLSARTTSSSSSTSSTSEAIAGVIEEKEVQAEPSYKVRLVWRNIIAFTYLHLGALYGIYLLVFAHARFYTFLWAFLMASMGAMGITAGAHRLWSHRAYKAKWPLRVLLAAFQTMAFQNHIYEWVRDHRVHHKFSETDADPHNANRGFFFSHVGWLLCRKHPDVRRRGKTVDMSDLEQDAVVMWQKRTYLVLMPLLCFALPVWLPCYLWNEKGWTSWYVSGILRYVLSLNATWLVNSAAHIWGVKPYDKTISPTENKSVAIAAFGEGWHNYHHVFPWDYKAAELGNYRFNLTTAFIDFFSWVGWAYDLKSVPVELVNRRAQRTGDGTHKPRTDVAEEIVDVNHNNNHHHHHHHHHKEGETPIWGWGDRDMPFEDTRDALRSFRSR